MIHRCNYKLLSQVYCVWQVVKTPTFIFNNPVLILYCLFWCHVWHMSLVFMMPNLICSYNSFLYTHLSFGKIHRLNLSVLYFEVSFLWQKLKNFYYHCTLGFALVVEIHMKQKHLWCSIKVRFWRLILAVQWRCKVKLFLSMPCRHIGRLSDIAPLSLKCGTGERWVVIFTPKLLYHREGTLSVNWPGGRVVSRASQGFLGEKSLVLTKNWTPDCPACSVDTLQTAQCTWKTGTET